MNGALLSSSNQLIGGSTFLHVWQLGNIKAAYEDLSSAIVREPCLADAYWQRHLVNIVLSRPSQAINDLNLLLKLNKSHVSALKSRYHFDESTRGFLFLRSSWSSISLSWRLWSVQFWNHAGTWLMAKPCSCFTECSCLLTYSLFILFAYGVLCFVVIMLLKISIEI